jgi:hypothetical protein
VIGAEIMNPESLVFHKLLSFRIVEATNSAMNATVHPGVNCDPV